MKKCLFDKFFLLAFSISASISAFHENFIKLYSDEQEELTAIINNKNFPIKTGGGRTSLRDGHQLNKKDSILQKLDEKKQQLLIVKLQNAVLNSNENIFYGTFNINLKSY